MSLQRQCCPPPPVNCPPPVKSTKTAHVPCCTQPDPSLFHRSVYSSWTPSPAAQCSEPPASVGVQTENVASKPVCDKETTAVEREPSFEDSVALIGHHPTAAVLQCRQHIDDISKEAASMEELLNELASTSASAQRDRVLDAVHKLDSLRRHINSTQQLLSNVDAMVQTCNETQPADKTSSTPSRTELLHRELGRLNSRLCCTVLALERAMSKAICRGTQSGLITMRSAADKPDCCRSGLQKSTSDAAVLDQPVVASQSIADNGTASRRTPGICEQWLNSQQVSNTVPPTPADAGQLEHNDPCQTLDDTVVATGRCCEEASSEHKTRAGDDCPASTLDETAQQQQSADCQQVSLQDIHRMLGNIISDIDQPANDEQNTGLGLDECCGTVDNTVVATTERCREEAISKHEQSRTGDDWDYPASTLDETAQQQQQQHQSADSQQESLEDIHRKAPVDVASNLSVMTDSTVASSINLLPVQQTSLNNNHELSETEHDETWQNVDVDDNDKFAQESRSIHDDCRLFHCTSFDDMTDDRQ